MSVPRPRGRAFKMSEPDLVAAISAWREAYETDPRVSHYTIAAAIGVSQTTVSKRVRLLGWVVSGSAVRARTRKGARFEDFPARAAASVWQFARGAATTTVRHGGRHVEVLT